MGMAMYMYFTKDYNFYVLFEGWMVMDTAALGWSCFGLFLMAMLLEFVRAGRTEIERNATVNSITPQSKNFESKNSESKNSESKDSESANVGVMTEVPSNFPSMKTMITCPYLLSSFLYIFQMTLSYFVMLAAMSFSAWIFISIIAGFTVGNYLVAWKSWGKLTRRDECCD